MRALGLSVDIQVFDLNGRKVGEIEPSSGRLQAARGQTLANGVYLSVITIQGQGKTMTMVKKIAIIR